jgi:hypothetical protein
MPLVLDGTLGASAVQDNSVTDTDLSLTANSAAIKVALNADNGAPIFACRAWVNFNGTGTVAIRASGNVSSITDNGTGDYTVNFATAMPDANYAAAGQGSGITTSGFTQFEATTVRTASAYRFVVVNNAFSNTDSTYANVSIFR